MTSRTLLFAVFALATGLAFAAPAGAADATTPSAAPAPSWPAAPSGGVWHACRLDRTQTPSSMVRTADPQPRPASLPPGYRPCDVVPLTSGDPCPRGCAPRKRCEWTIGLMGWLPGMDGDLTIGGQQNTVDFNWTDWFDNLDKIDFALEIFLRYRYDRWWGELYGMRMELGDSVPIAQVSGAQLDATIGVTVLKALVGWDICRTPLSVQNCWPCLTTSMYAGVRYYNLAVEANLQGPAGGVARVVNETQDWLDPLIGARLWLDITRDWAFFLDGDIGGFGAGSDLSWSIAIGAQWRPLQWFGLQFGWNMLDVDYATGAGADLFVWDLTLSGPFLNLQFFF